jgi:hypothetical protein
MIFGEIDKVAVAVVERVIAARKKYHGNAREEEQKDDSKYY